MWASCCNWFCLDSATGDEGGGNTRHQAYTNSGFSSFPSPTAVDHTCKACGGRFDTLTRKHMCMDCKKSFCSRCSAQLELQPRLCLTCQRLCATLFDRAELMKLKVKDLRDYLHLHQVPTQMCREKEELVELVLGQQTPAANATSQATANVRVTQQQPPPPPQPPPPAAVPPQHVHTRAPSSAHTHHTSQQNGQTAPMAGPVSAGPTVTQPRSEPHRPPTPPVQEDSQSLSALAPSALAPSAPEEGPEDEADTELRGEQESQSSDTEEVLVPGRRASLTDLLSAEDIEALSVRQLKEILARNFVDYKGCCEKWELMERVTRLYHDQKDLQNLDLPSGPVIEENLCKICMDSPIDCVLLECGHMVTCTKCGKRMSECPICRQYVVRAVHVFRS
ncbi:E3 ubiquitin-protein ligase rififylin isoform X2 [Clupea harengus]|uniref:RING-type E3 ubiquitin transferase n=1 Tax=Clupea harengus TaxID=7950 RepID=A0A6P8FNE9_CLUHA|nr:E3 ubiquitin-protein ligase rififylin isoform X2 [Clupea harengus]